MKTQQLQTLIDAWRDDCLKDEQAFELNQLLRESKEARQFFQAESQLHGMLHCAVAGSVVTAFGKSSSTSNSVFGLPTITKPATWTSWPVGWAASVCLALLTAFLFWHSPGMSPASAAVLELNRIMVANAKSMDRTFRISVEETVVPTGDRDRKSPEHDRPPKPSLDGAILDVRGSNQFVLKRDVPSGELFITGSNGTTSWAVRPDGPVRFSDDLARFNRDLPGHERNLPINNLHDGLDALRTAYELNTVSTTSSGDIDEQAAEASSLIIAERKRGYRGAARVEIRYATSSGQIREMRFIQMPYGTELVTLKMALVGEQTLPETYFDHRSHHVPGRDVEHE